MKLDAVGNGRGKISMAPERRKLDVVAEPKCKASSSLDKVAEMRPKRDSVPDDAFTLGEYAKRFGLGRTCAKRELDALVDDGRLKTAMTKKVGHFERAYWPI